MSSTHLVVTGSMNLLGGNVCVYSHLPPSSHIPGICGQIMRVWEQGYKHLKEGFQLWSQNSQSIETLCKAGSALENAQMSWPLPIKIQLGTRVSQKVDHKPKLPWPCSYVTAVSMTLILCAGVIITVVPGSSSAFVSYCMWHKLSLAMRLGGMIPVYHVYCTLFELWFEWCFYLMVCLSPLLHIVRLVWMLSWQLANDLRVTTA